MRYQFTLDGRAHPSYPVRDSWMDAATDAVNAGHAVWIDPYRIKLDDCLGAEISRIQDKEE